MGEAELAMQSRQAAESCKARHCATTNEAQPVPIRSSQTEAVAVAAATREGDG